MTIRDDGLSIGEVVEQTGLSVHALRFYERAGLFAADIERSLSGQRRYRPSDVEWLRVCIRLRRTGMPLADIRGYAELVAAGSGNEEQRLELMRAHQERIREQQAELRAAQEIIDGKVAAYRAHLDSSDPEGLWVGEPVVCTIGEPPEEGAAEADAAHAAGATFTAR